MRKPQRDKSIDLRASLSGVLVIVLSIVCFLVLLEIVVALVKFFAG